MKAPIYPSSRDIYYQQVHSLGFRLLGLEPSCRDKVDGRVHWIDASSCALRAKRVRVLRDLLARAGASSARLRATLWRLDRGSGLSTIWAEPGARHRAEIRGLRADRIPRPTMAPGGGLRR